MWGRRVQVPESVTLVRKIKAVRCSLGREQGAWGWEILTGVAVEGLRPLDEELLNHGQQIPTLPALTVFIWKLDS